MSACMRLLGKKLLWALSFVVTVEWVGLREQDGGVGRLSLEVYVCGGRVLIGRQGV